MTMTKLFDEKEMALIKDQVLMSTNIKFVANKAADGSTKWEAFKRNSFTNPTSWDKISWTHDQCVQKIKSGAYKLKYTATVSIGEHVFELTKKLYSKDDAE